MISLPRALNKPEYFYNPKQMIVRLQNALAPSRSGTLDLHLFGHKFRANLGDDIGRAIQSYGLYDLCVSEILYRLIQKGDTVLDVGANIGYFSVLMASCVGESGRVYSFEPNPQILHTLKQNTSAWKNLTVMPWALSEANGQQDLFAPESYDKNKGLASLSPGSGETIASVELKRLDDLRISAKIIKMDVEGHELKVLLGAPQTLKNVEHIVFEDHDLMAHGVYAHLKEAGYHVYYLKKQFSHLQLVPVESSYSISTFEPPNYLATRFSADKILSMVPRDHWAFLKHYR